MSAVSRPRVLINGLGCTTMNVTDFTYWMYVNCLGWPYVLPGVVILKKMVYRLLRDVYCNVASGIAALATQRFAQRSVRDDK